MHIIGNTAAEIYLHYTNFDLWSHYGNLHVIVLFDLVQHWVLWKLVTSFKGYFFLLLN